MLSQPTGRLDAWPPSFVERSACSSAKRASKAFTSSSVISSMAGNQGKIEVLMGQYWKVMGKSMTGWWCNNHLEKYEWNIIETTNQMINGVYSWDNHHRTIFSEANRGIFQQAPCLIGRYGKYHGIRTNYLRIDNWQLNIFGPIIFRKQRYNIVLDYVVTIEYGWYSQISGVASLPRCFLTKDHHPKKKPFERTIRVWHRLKMRFIPKELPWKNGDPLFIYMAVCQNLVPL